MTRSPDEIKIKKGLEVCNIWMVDEPNRCMECPYFRTKDCADTLMKHALALIQQLEAQVPRWIPVEERLPEHEGWVLAIGLLLKKKKGSYGWSVPHVAEFRHGRWCDFDGMLPDLEDRSIKITHWMPLPEPPKEE